MKIMNVVSTTIGPLETVKQRYREMVEGNWKRMSGRASTENLTHSDRKECQVRRVFKR